MMRPFRLIVSVALACGLLATPAMADWPAKRLALVVGVSQYADRSLGTQPYADNDAQGLADALKARGYQVVLMTQAAGGAMTPSAANVAKELEKMTSTAGLGAGDTVIVALSGRGVELGAGDGPAVHFLPADADAGTWARTLPVKAIYDKLGNCPAGTKLLVADLFRAGPQVPGSPASRPAMPVFPAPPDGLAVYLGCSPQQLSVDDPAAKRGVFFNYVITGLEGKADANHDDKVTLAELTAYAEAGVYDAVRRLSDGTQQVPELKGLTRPAALAEGPAVLRPTTVPLPVPVPVPTPTPTPTPSPVAVVPSPTSPGGQQPWVDPVRPTPTPPPPVRPTPVTPTPRVTPPAIVPIVPVGPTSVLAPRPPPSHRLTRIGTPVHKIEKDFVEDYVKALAGKKDGVKELTEAAEEDRKPAGMFYYALMYEHGASALVNPDPATAAKWYRAAADQGITEAMISLAYLYQRGVGVKVDAAEAFRWRLRAAEAGDPLAMYLVGADCAYGNGVKPDANVAKQWMRQAADAGDEPARAWLAENP